MPLKTNCTHFSLGDACRIKGHCPYVSFENGLENLEFNLGCSSYEPPLDFYSRNPDQISQEELEDLKCYAKLEDKDDWLPKIGEIEEKKQD